MLSRTAPSGATTTTSAGRSASASASASQTPPPEIVNAAAMMDVEKVVSLVVAVALVLVVGAVGF